MTTLVLAVQSNGKGMRVGQSKRAHFSLAEVGLLRELYPLTPWEAHPERGCVVALGEKRYLVTAPAPWGTNGPFLGSIERLALSCPPSTNNTAPSSSTFSLTLPTG